MLRVGYEKIVSRHYRRHLVEPAVEQTFCGLRVESLVHLPAILDPSGFLAIGADAEVCRKCVARVNSAKEWHGEILQDREGGRWAETLQRMAADGGHLVVDA
jgi:hypothetical protein